MHADNALVISITAFEQGVQALARPKVFVERAWRLDMHEIGMRLRELVWQNRRMTATGSVKMRGHQFTPQSAEGRVGFGHDERVPQRGPELPARLIPDISFASQDERSLIEPRRNRVYENCVDVCIDAAVCEQFIKPNEILLMRVHISSDRAILVWIILDKGN